MKNLQPVADPGEARAQQVEGATPSGSTNLVGSFVRITNGRGRGKVMSGPYYLVRGDQGGHGQYELASDLMPLG